MTTFDEVYNYIRASAFAGYMKSYLSEYEELLSGGQLLKVLLWEEEIMESLMKIIDYYETLFTHFIPEDSTPQEMLELSVTLAEKNYDPKIPGFFRAIAADDENALNRMSFSILDKRFLKKGGPYG